MVFLLPDAIADAAYRAYEGLAAGAVDFPSQIAYMDIELVVRFPEIRTPGFIQKLASIERLTGMTHHRIEKTVFFRREREGLACPQSFMAILVYDKIRDFQNRKLCGLFSTEDRSDSRQKLFYAEGFDDVVVRAEIEAADPVFHKTSRGQHDDGSLDLMLSQFSANLEAVFLGHHDIEKDESVIVLESLCETLLAVVGDVDGVAFFVQSLFQYGDELPFVLNDKNGHPSRIVRADKEVK